MRERCEYGSFQSTSSQSAVNSSGSTRSNLGISGNTRTGSSARLRVVLGCCVPLIPMSGGFRAEVEIASRPIKKAFWIYLPLRGFHICVLARDRAQIPSAANDEHSFHAGSFG